MQLLDKGVSYIKDVPSATLEPLVKAGTLTGSADPEVLGSADVIIICVPTPLNKTKDPDNSFIVDAAEMLAARMKRPQLIVLESTTFPGFTREVLLPLFVQAGRKPARTSSWRSRRSASIRATPSTSRTTRPR